MSLYQSTPVYSCFLGRSTSKAFVPVDHWKLFNKLIVTKVPLLMVRTFIFWYSKQEMYIEWGQSKFSFSLFGCCCQARWHIVSAIITLMIYQSIYMVQANVASFAFY